jgi:hypothetical protein
MKELSKTLLVILLSGTCSLATQNSKQSSGATAGATTSANAQAQANKSRTLSLDSGTQIDAEITSALDLKKAKPGDSFKMKTLKAVKKDGKEIISRGSTIIGHVQQSATTDKTTQATLVFDRLVDNKSHLASSLSAVVTAISKPTNATAMAQEDTMATVSPRGSGTSQRSSQNGGLIGGVAQTAGGVVQGVGQAAGGVAGQAGSTVSSTANKTLASTTGSTGAVGSNVGGLTRGPIQIVNDTTSSAASGSTLTMASGNAKLESGTQFMLHTTSALTLTQQLKNN